jgi:hypothetical protein
MDRTFRAACEYQLDQLIDHPTMNVNLRRTDPEAEALLWLNGARCRMIGVRDEEPHARGRAQTPGADGGLPG